MEKSRKSHLAHIAVHPEMLQDTGLFVAFLQRCGPSWHEGYSITYQKKKQTGFLDSKSKKRGSNKR
jgi:hypothetical protein